MANEVKIVLSANDLASGKISKLKKGLGGVNSTLQNSQRGMLAAGAASVAFGVMAVRAAADFDKGMREVNTLINVSNGELDSLGGQVRELSKEFGINAVDATKALYSAISAGQEPAEAIGFLGVAAKTAIGGVTDLETAVDGLTSVVNAFGYESSETQDVADIMFETMRRGKTTIGELSDFFFQAAPVSSALGVTFEELSASITTLTLSGTPTRVAMTQVRQAMVALAKPTADMEELFKAVGYESGLAAIRSDGLVGALTKLQKESGATETEFIKAVGSIDALQAVMGLTGSNTPAFLENMEAMEDAAGNVDDAYAIMAESTSQSFAIMTSAMQDAKIEIGENLAPAMEEAAKQATTLSEAVAWLPSWVTTTTIALGGFAGAIGISTLAWGQLSKVAIPATNGIRAAFGAMTLAGATWAVGIGSAIAVAAGVVYAGMKDIEKTQKDFAVRQNAQFNEMRILDEIISIENSIGAMSFKSTRSFHKIAGEIDGFLTDSFLSLDATVKEVTENAADYYLSLYDEIKTFDVKVMESGRLGTHEFLKQRGLEKEAIASVVKAEQEANEEVLRDEEETNKKRLKLSEAFWTLKAAKSKEDFDRLTAQMLSLPSVIPAGGMASGGRPDIEVAMRAFKSSQNSVTDALAAAKAFLAAGVFSGAQAAATAKAEVDRLLGITQGSAFKGDALGALVGEARGGFGGAPPMLPGMKAPERFVRGENGMQKEQLGQGGWTIVIEGDVYGTDDFNSTVNSAIRQAEQIGATS